MATEFDDSQHWGFFLTGLTLTSDTGKSVRMSELVLAALRAAGVFDNMVDGTSPPTTDKLWLDKNFDPAQLKQWDATGSSWAPMTFSRLFARAAVTLMTVTGGTGNAIVVAQPTGFRNDNLYSFVPTADNTGPATIQVSGVGTYPAKYADNSDVEAGEFTAGRQNILLFTGSRFTVLFQMSDLNAATGAAQQAAQEANDSAESAAISETNAQKWATNPEDTPVTTGPDKFSAYHWAQKAAAAVTGGIASAIHAAAAKSPPVDADEFGIADSAASWALKKLTWLAVRLGVFVQAAVAVASAATTDIGSAASFFISITGTTTITSLGSAAGIQVGTLRLVQFAGALTLTNNANIILPTAANITTAANDFMLARYEGAGVWRVIWYRGALSTVDWTAGTSTKPGMPTPAQISAAIAALSSKLKVGAAVAPSGNAVTYSGIPAGVARFTVHLRNVVFSSAAQGLVRVRTAGANVVTGYDGMVSFQANGSSNAAALNTSVLLDTGVFTTTLNGSVTFTRVPGTHDWEFRGGFSGQGGTPHKTEVSGGVLAGTEIDGIQVSSAAGTPTMSGTAIWVDWE
ncbi:hypothetical protein QTL95_27055 [Rhizobium sp. S152]|uniref:hypothetical protein n=1 Tax=Rhizobium sp. S152 TaxID=3055038 RepID=UPI0025A973C2|nr:hypothetical protein [Rhizobium sp. S152]MDM9629548.1 hypothetical protein [Rhizobium sp. S152]